MPLKLFLVYAHDTHPINRVASVTLQSRVITYFVVRIYGYVVRFKLLVHPETGTNTNSSI